MPSAGSRAFRAALAAVRAPDGKALWMVIAETEPLGAGPCGVVNSADGVICTRRRAVARYGSIPTPVINEPSVSLMDAPHPQCETAGRVGEERWASVVRMGVHGTGAPIPCVSPLPTVSDC